MRLPFLRRPGVARLVGIVSLLLGGISVARGAVPVVSGDPVVRQVGFGGAYKVGKWTPVEVALTLTAPAAVQLVLEAPDPHGNRAAFPTVERRLEAGTHRLTGHVLVGRLDGEIRARVAVRTGEAARTWPAVLGEGITPSAPLRQSVRLIATLGRPPGFAPDPDERRRPAEQTPDAGNRRVIELDDPAQLPQDVTGYDSLDVLVIAGDYALDPQRSDALEDWVRLGGHLVLAVGSEIEAYRDSRLSDWIPVAVGDEPVTLRDLKAVESFIERSTRLVLPGGKVSAADLQRKSPATETWQILIGGSRRPLLVRTAVGFGKVTVLALDLNQPPLSTWTDLPALVGRLIADRRDAGEAARQTGRALARSGITDLATQLRAVQEQFPAVERLPLWAVLLLMLGYLLLIGPLDYLLVHRLLGRPRLTWITFPLMVAGAAVLAVWGAQETNGEQLRLNQLDLVDVDAQSGLVRRRSWLSVYSPAMQRYAVAADPTEAEQTGSELRMGWSGVPEAGYGGLYRTGGLRIGSPAYEFAGGARAVENLPIPLWGTGSLAVTDRREAAALVESRLASTGTGRLQGTLRHHLPGPVTDWIIAYNKRIYLPQGGNDVLPPDAELRIDDETVRAPELGFYLTKTIERREERHKGVGEEIRLVQGRYEPLDSGLPPREQLYDILQMMTFHEAAGGTAYTGLEHQSLRDLDFSDLVMDLNRAVLFARVDLRAFGVTINGRPVEPGRHFAFVRIVLPVTPLRYGE